MAEEQHDLGGTSYLQLVGLGAVIGVPAALLAALFLALVHDLEHWLWTDLPDHLGHASPPWYLVVGLPLAGAFVVLVARRFLPGDGGVSPLVGRARSRHRSRMRRESPLRRWARSPSAPFSGRRCR